MDTIARTTQIGISDLPVGLGQTGAGKDQLGMATYCEGLTDFILRCPTPMTVAVQGDWGTGKTSTMWLVAERLKKSAATVVTFNTWQYSQFDLGDTLIFHLLQKIMGQIRGDSEKKTKLLEGLAALIRAGKSAAAVASQVAAERFGGEIAGAAVGAFSGELMRPGGDPSPVGLIEELREKFAELIRQNNGESGRTVIFIDDLDRIRPARAVEIMEVLKSVMDVEGCVYVLAIDFSVVLQGVQEKYGDKFDARKAAAFFDKIIQIPFHMPVSSYDIEPLLKMHGRDFGDDTGAAVDLLRYSVGRNPRSVKRILNAIALNECIQEKVTGNDGTQGLRPVEFLASAALQTAYPGFYELLDREDPDGKAALLEGLLLRHEPDDVGASVSYGVAEEDLPALHEFLDRYATALTLWRGGSPRSIDGQRVEDLMRITSITMGHRASARESRAARVLDLETRMTNQEARGLDSAVLERLHILERAVRDAVGPFMATEAKNGSLWRWYVQRPGDDRRASGGLFCEVLLPFAGRPTFYVGKKSWAGAEELRGRAEELINDGWDVAVKEESNALIHVRSVPPEADLQRLVPLLVASHDAARVHSAGSSRQAQDR